ncbi:formylglycine-generating enzyme family protein [Pseudoduganella buxea]|uniref:SUMF1/EgtB/PvdO family nonheme iron enzyme n=1 Tax=Pseudoduganella buxea TaxID=1949069 RepID=A0A6I3T070_9BURK|nr:SUMF1/EgtB/PvdO family nonheme iron enzyme [Pseudoduganella buxea]MTV54950.1 SUMF1/EgtB/PvdO family nonheme iron enzyme [Pseudoduganella buxea]GGC17277.1 hypothetical protein GCM10011572_43250 [Pseudoduganella buxea]
MLRRANLLPAAALICLFTHAHAAPVTPPKIPQMNSEYVDESKLVALKQPPALAAELDALGKGSIKERVARLKKKVIADLIFVEGGTFMMGDFGVLWSPEKLPYSFDVTSRPVHEVTLSSFSISKYKTTYAEFDVYTDATGTERAATDDFGLEQRYPQAPVGVRWQRAKDYCQWLGKITSLPFDLPTEAQWEYAARSRGQFFVWATDNGSIEFGRNIPAADQKKLLTPSNRHHYYPVGLFPPNPLGLYDASHNGEEWTNDWFDKDYYEHSPKADPKGPPEGLHKAVRGWPNGDSIVPNTMFRRARPLIEYPRDLGDFGMVEPSYFSFKVRCAVKQPMSIQ